MSASISAIYATASENAGLPAVTTQSTLESGRVAKPGPGNLYSVYVTNTGTDPGYLFTMNSVDVPGDGTLSDGVIVDCIAVGSAETGGVNYSPGPPEYFSVGICVCFSSTAPPVKTAAGSCFFNARVK